MTENWCSTKKTVTKYSLTWTIENFRGIRHEIESSIFPSRHHDIKWKLSIPVVEHGCLLLHLHKIEGQLKSTVNCCVSISNHKHERSELIQEYVDLNEDNFHSVGHTFDRGLLGDKFTIYCEVEEFGDLKLSSSGLGDSPQIQCTLADNLGGLFKSQKFSDVTIGVGAREFEAHKAILAVRSPVFNAMFSHNMQESQSNRVEVTDVEPNVFEELLRYIYTGKSSFELTPENIHSDGVRQYSSAIEVFKAADKYQLNGLRLICEIFLDRKLSLESVVEILILADRYDMAWLKNQAIEFASFHARELIKVGAWKMLADHNPGVLAEIFASQWPATNP